MQQMKYNLTVLCNTINDFKRPMRTLKQHAVLRPKKKFWIIIPIIKLFKLAFSSSES